MSGDAALKIWRSKNQPRRARADLSAIGNLGERWFAPSGRRSPATPGCSITDPFADGTTIIMLAVALLSAPNFAIHRTGHWAHNWSNHDWPRPQHDAGPYDATGNELTKLNDNVLIEIGAAMALYGKKVILLVERGVPLPSNLQGLYRCDFEGDKLEYESTMKLLKTFSQFR